MPLTIRATADVLPPVPLVCWSSPQHGLTVVPLTLRVAASALPPVPLCLQSDPCPHYPQTLS